MKRLIIFSFFIFMMLLSVPIVAQQTALFGNNSEPGKENVQALEQRAKIAFNVIPVSLENKITGIVESTIYTLILVKKYYPSADYSEIMNQLNKIAKGNSDPSIRAKALLAHVYLGSSNILKINPKSDTFERDYIFKQITEQLVDKLSDIKYTEGDDIF